MATRPAALAARDRSRASGSSPDAACRDRRTIQCAAARSSGHLAQELEGALTGAEVRKVDADVGIHDPDEGDPREVQALRVGEPELDGRRELAQ